ncbi:hypothetical protein [Nostocoides vanveenii]
MEVTKNGRRAAVLLAVDDETR